MRAFLVVTGLVIAGATFTACAARPAANGEPGSTDSPLDMTGADVTRWDSLPRTSVSPPIMLTPPRPIFPLPEAMRNTEIIVVLTVDERGRVARVSMTPPADRAYGRRLAADWLRMRFRPPTTSDGTPTTGYYKFAFTF